MWAVHGGLVSGLGRRRTPTLSSLASAETTTGTSTTAERPQQRSPTPPAVRRSPSAVEPLLSLVSDRRAIKRQKPISQIRSVSAAKPGVGVKSGGRPDRWADEDGLLYQHVSGRRQRSELVSSLAILAPVRSRRDRTSSSQLSYSTLASRRPRQNGASRTIKRTMASPAAEKMYQGQDPITLSRLQADGRERRNI